MAGTLFVVATPIGNLEDLSFRALRTLKEVDLIAAEDTRRTARLLAHYAVRKPMVSLHEHNEQRETPKLVARLTAGESIALVSDAGTPGISDPGAYLVRTAREHGIQVSPIPGPSAVMAALSVSGVPGTPFVFLGFPPRSGSARAEWFDHLVTEPRAIVFFEAPHRIERTLNELATKLANRPIHIHRELTKIHEESVIYHNKGKILPASVLGEFAVVIENIEEKSPESQSTERDLARAVALFCCMTAECKYNSDEAELLVAKALALDPRVVRKAVKKARIAQKRRDEALS